MHPQALSHVFFGVITSMWLAIFIIINVDMRKAGPTMLASCNVVAFQHQGTHKILKKPSKSSDNFETRCISIVECGGLLRKRVPIISSWMFLVWKQAQLVRPTIITIISVVTRKLGAPMWCCCVSTSRDPSKLGTPSEISDGLYKTCSNSVVCWIHGHDSRMFALHLLGLHVSISFLVRFSWRLQLHLEAPPNILRKERLS